MAAKKSSGGSYTSETGRQVASAMHRRKQGTLKSGPGGKGGTVRSREQAIAIGLSEAREEGEPVPAPRKRSAKKSAAKKSAAKKGGVRKGAAKKTGARKSAAKRSGGRKSSAKKSGGRKSSAKKSSRR